MPVSGFLSSIADKAQSAINQTPLAGHVPGITPCVSSADQATSPAGYRSFALESLQHQIRSIGQQYSPVTPVQRIITLEKGVALGYDAVSRDSKSQSKELYNLGQHDDADLTDVTDRLAFLNFVHGSLSASLATKLDAARTPLKALRDAEAAIAPKRNIRAGLRNQIARLEHGQERGGERRVTELKQQLSRTESVDEEFEKEFSLQKRKAIRESEQKKWEAVREYGEKLVLLSQASNLIIGALPTLPPTTARPYTGAEVTAAARASLQHALDNYKPGQLNFNLQTAADLSRSDTRSFGESHALELNSLASPEHDSHPGLSVTPPPESVKGDHCAAVSAQPPAEPKSVIPVQPVSGVVQSISSNDTPKPFESRAEELYDTSPAKPESAEGAQQPAEAAGNETAGGGAAGAGSAEEEKKRLEMAERERVLAGGAEPTADDLPPYKEIQE